MKKIISIITVCILCMLLILPVHAASASATLTGPGTVRAGDTITLSFNLNGSGIYGASGTLSYNSNYVTLTGTTQKVASPWAVEFNGNNFVAYDNNLSNPISGNKTIFTATFKVKSVAVGTNISISYTGVKASDGNADINVGTVIYSKSVSAPLASNNNLSSLTVSNATISPAFNANTTNYTANVPFSVSKLNITAKAADGKARVSVNSPALTPNGTTKVTVVVTAENGISKTYTISVTRAQDPNYQASSNNSLSGISVNGYVLSPVFNPSVTSYVVWLPYETTSITVNGTPKDSKASVRVEGGSNLTAGQDNTVKVVCRAEDGTEKIYTVIAKRAAAHIGTLDPSATETPDSAKPTLAPSATETPDSAKPTLAPDNDVSSAKGIAIWMVIIIAVGALAVGFVVGMLVFKKKD